jgi:hypothetical protein
MLTTRPPKPSFVCVNKHHVSEANVGAKVPTHIFVTLALDGGEWRVSCAETALCLGDSHQYPLIVNFNISYV